MEYKDRVEPCQYTFYLLFGLFMLGMCIVVMTHIFDYVALTVNGLPIAPFLNQWLERIQSNNKSEFIAIVVFCFIGYYILYCAHKGHTKVGLRFYFLNFYK